MCLRAVSVEPTWASVGQPNKTKPSVATGRNTFASSKTPQPDVRQTVYARFGGDIGLVQPSAAVGGFGDRKPLRLNPRFAAKVRNGVQTAQSGRLPP